MNKQQTQQAFNTFRNRLRADGRQHGDITTLEAFKAGIEAAQSAPVAAQEPLAWKYAHGAFRHFSGATVPDRTFVSMTRVKRDRYYDGCTEWSETPLYASQQAQGEPLAPAGWKLVPTAPTDEMMGAAWDISNWLHGTPEGDDPLPRHQYQAMLAAAPTSPETWKVLPSQAAEEWISIEERLPEPKTVVLLTVHYENHGEDDDGTQHVTSGAAIDFGQYVNSEHGGYIEAFASPHAQHEYISHWMPLPTPAPMLASKPTGEPIQEAISPLAQQKY